MKISLHLHQQDAHLRLNLSKSSKHHTHRPKKTLKVQPTNLQAQPAMKQMQVPPENLQSQTKRQRSLSKKPCSHKKNTVPNNRIDNHDYHARGIDPDDLRRQNEKLMKENKILNEYFDYFQKKYKLKTNHRSQKVFSFRQVEPDSRLFFGDTPKTVTSNETKASSCFRQYGQ